jgi:hypothetical protein
MLCCMHIVAGIEVATPLVLIIMSYLWQPCESWVLLVTGLPATASLAVSCGLDVAVQKINEEDKVVLKPAQI